MKKIFITLIAIITVLPLCIYAEVEPYELKLSADDIYCHNGKVINVTVTLGKIEVSGGVGYVYFELFYDKSKVEPTVQNDPDNENSGMNAFLVTKPDDKWEGLCRLDTERGCYELAYMTESTALAAADASIVVTVPFKVKDNKDGIEFYIGDNACADYGFKQYYASGDNLFVEASPEPPAKPAVDYITFDTIAFKKNEGVSYRLTAAGYDSGWQSGSVFKGLTPATAYTVICRYDSHGANADVSESLNVNTLPETITLNSGSDYQIDDKTSFLLGVCEKVSYADFIKQFYNAKLTVKNIGGKVVTGGYIGTGTTVELYDASGKLIDSVCVVVMGDLSGDGEISSADILLIKRAYLGTAKLSDCQTASALVAGGDSIKPVDYLMIKRHFGGTYNIYLKK